MIYAAVALAALIQWCATAHDKAALAVAAERPEA